VISKGVRRYLSWSAGRKKRGEDQDNPVTLLWKSENMEYIMENDINDHNDPEQDSDSPK
jgi:hypothetical protein